MSNILGPLEFVGGVAVGTGVGTGISRAVEPEAQDIANASWSANPSLPVDPDVAAAIVAEDVEQMGWGASEAQQTGINGTRFAAMVGEALNAPGLETLFQLWRRGLIGDGDFVHGLRKGKLETRWDGGLHGLHDVLLSSAELAMMQQQGFIDQARADSEGALQGVTAERQQLRFEVSGLPPGVAEALDMLRRGIIDDATFTQIVREGHTKTKYTPQLLQLRNRVLTHNDYVQANLRAWIDTAAMHAGGALTGYTPADMDLLFKIHGRPATAHQIFIGERRGGVYDGPTTGIDPAFLKGLQESDIRPEWYNLLWAQRYTYPAAFVLRSLTEAGDITEQQAHDILLFEGWEPTLAATVSHKWAAQAGTAAAAKPNPYVTKAHNSLFTAMHKAAVGATTEPAAIQEGFDYLQVPGDAQAQIREAWAIEGRL